MKRIAFLVCGIVLLVANTGEARGRRGGYSYTQPTTYSRPTYSQPTAASVTVAQPSQTITAAPAATTTVTAYKPVVTAPAPAVAATSYSTATAQGVANLMAARGTVGHFGGNSGYEGCGMASSPSAAYNMCCYANSGMATVDVGYAQGSNGMWYCCRRYR